VGIISLCQINNDESSKEEALGIIGGAFESEYETADSPCW
jgi:hypothetical protein